MPFCLSLKQRPSCQTLSKALDMSKKTALVSSTFSNVSKISVVIDRSWLMVESPGRNPDWFLVKRLFLEKKEYMQSKMTFSNILLQMGSREIGR